MKEKKTIVTLTHTRAGDLIECEFPSVFSRLSWHVNCDLNYVTENLIKKISV